MKKLINFSAAAILGLVMSTNVMAQDLGVDLATEESAVYVDSANEDRLLTIKVTKEEVANEDQTVIDFVLRAVISKL